MKYEAGVERFIWTFPVNSFDSVRAFILKAMLVNTQTGASNLSNNCQSFSDGFSIILCDWLLLLMKQSDIATVTK